MINRIFQKLYHSILSATLYIQVLGYATYIWYKWRYRKWRPEVTECHVFYERQMPASCWSIYPAYVQNLMTEIADYSKNRVVGNVDHKTGNYGC